METSLIKVFKFRLCQYFKTVSFKDFILQLDLFLILLGFLWLAIDRNSPTLAFEYHGGIIMKVFVFFNVYVFWETIVSAIVRIGIKMKGFLYISVKNTQKTSKYWLKLDGFDVSAIIEIILSKSGLPTNDLLEIGFTPRKIKKLGDNLERIGILSRGENNARILNTELEKDQILSKLISCEDSDQLTPLLHEVGEWSWNIVKPLTSAD